VFTSTTPARKIVQALAYRCCRHQNRKNVAWHISCYFVMFSEIFSISAISCSLVIRWCYQHLILAVEVKNSAKDTLPSSFNATALFPHVAMLWKMTYLKRVIEFMCLRG